MAKKSFMDILEESHKLVEADEEPIEEPIDDEDEEIDDEDEEANIDDVPTGKGDYSADELREVIEYVYEILDKEDDDELNDSVGEIGLDLLDQYADLLPQTVINQIVDDLKEIFEIEDTMLESIMSEGAKFVKKAKGPAAKAAAKKARAFYKKNKAKIKKNAKLWRKSAHGKKMVALHKKVMERLGAKKGMRLVTAPTAQV